MANSVELGPGIRLAAPSRSKNRSSLTQCRRRAISLCIIAICAAGPPKAIVPSLRKSFATSPAEPLENCASSAIGSAASLLIALSDLFQRTLGDGQCLESGFQILIRMSSKKFTAMLCDSLNRVQPLLCLKVSFSIRSVLDFATEPRVLERLFQRVLSNFERKDSMCQIFVSGFFMNRL